MAGWKDGRIEGQRDGRRWKLGQQINRKGLKQGKGAAIEEPWTAQVRSLCTPNRLLLAKRTWCPYSVGGGGVVQGMLVSMCDSYAKQFTFVVLLICYNNTGHSSFSNYFQLNSRERKQIELTPELFKKYLKSMCLHTQQCHGGTQLFIKESWIYCCWFVYDLKWSILYKMFCS